MQGSERVKRRMRRQAHVARPSRSNRVVALGYVRVSTGGQEDAYGLDAQESAIRSFASSQGYDLLNVIPDCVSGATAPGDRPGFAQVVELAKQDAFNVLLLYKFDRLARSVLYAVTSVHVLRDSYGIVVRSVTEPLDTSTPMGEMIFSILASMAAQERQTITERTLGGRKEKAKRGGYAGGGMPIGYKRDKDGGLQVVAEEAASVRRIFEARKAGRSLQSIADELNADGVPTKRGGKWRPGGVAYILDNPKYRGLVEYLFRYAGSDTHIIQPGAHQAIIA